MEETPKLYLFQLSTDIYTGVDSLDDINLEVNNEGEAEEEGEVRMDTRVGENISVIYASSPLPLHGLQKCQTSSVCPQS